MKSFLNLKKQKILNYEIRVIEECEDSLFTEMNCTHNRYLSWELLENIKEIVLSHPYSLRWIGNSRHSYLYAYAYVLIVGCASNPALMIDLKEVLYGLAQKYLPQFEQKLLI